MRFVLQKIVHMSDTNIKARMQETEVFYIQHWGFVENEIIQRYRNMMKILQTQNFCER